MQPPTIDETLAAFAAEAACLSAAMARASPRDFDRPTRCDPWTVGDLLAHVGIATYVVITMIEQPAPAYAEIGAAGYYRPDKRFSAATNDERVSNAVAAATRARSGQHLLARFSDTWSEVHDRVSREPIDRVVQTRHGDAILLSDFMVTRVVELAVHGLDLSDALVRKPWLNAAAAQVVADILLPEGQQDALDMLRWDHVTLLRKATGREQVTDSERDQLDSAGIHWLALG